MQAQPLLYSCTLILLLVCSAHAINTAVESVTSFVIAGTNNEKDTRSVKLTTADATVTCEFTYDCHSPVPSTQKPKNAPVEPLELLKQIQAKYKCVTHSENIFIYEVCMGQHVKQSAGEEHYLLGEYEGIKNDGKRPKMTFGKGTACAAGGHPRSAVVDFTCNQEYRIVSIREPTTCVYEVVVGVPEVCGHPAFAHTNAGGAAGTWETWVLEIAETEDGGYMCQVMNNGFDKHNSARFSSFSLRIKNTELNLAQSEVRRSNRKIVHSKKLVVKENPPSVESASSFGYGSIDYAYIRTE